MVEETGERSGREGGGERGRRGVCERDRGEISCTTPCYTRTSRYTLPFMFKLSKGTHSTPRVSH